MKATIGDRLVLECADSAAGRREGLVVRVEHADGSPPYLVRWLDTGRESLVFPGRDARVVAGVR